jgi:hypothetical protein
VETQTAKMSVDVPAAANRVGSIARGAVFRALCTRFATLKRDNDFNGLMQSFRSNACKILQDHFNENNSNLGVMQQELQAISDAFSVLNVTPVVTLRSVNDLEEYVMALEAIHADIEVKAEELNNMGLFDQAEVVLRAIDTYFEMVGGDGSQSGGSMPEMMAADNPPVQYFDGEGNESNESEEF